MMPVSSRTMRELDRMAAASGISTLTLMENAGEAVSNKAAELLRYRTGAKVAVFCGKGNNGGDGFVAARKLSERKFDIDAYLFGRQSEVKNETAANLKSFVEKSGKLQEITSDADIAQLQKRLNYSLIIDAVLGTGFSGIISGTLKNLIELLNSTGVPILAVDVPSGLDSTTGKINPVAIKAKWTISFALPKKGFYENNGPKQTGKLQTVNIGFPEELLKKAVEFENKGCILSK